MFKTVSKQIKGVAMAAVATSLAIAITSCGGGGTSLPIPQDNGQPVPGTADLTGTLVQGGGNRVISAEGAGLPDILVTLINTLTGGIAGMDMTDATGKFEFKGVPSGDNYLVKIEFQSANDLNGDGQPDQIELYVPVSLGDQAIVDMLQQIGVADSNGDGTLDAVELEYQLSSNGSTTETKREQHRMQEGKTIVDDNNNGSFDDDQGFDDSDGDGLEDADSADDSSNSSGGMQELEVKGVIEEITATSITVDGVTFAITQGTEWRMNDSNTGAGSFEAGMFVKVEGIPDGNGGWMAHQVEAEDGSSDDSSGDDNSGTDNSGDDNSGDDNSGDDYSGDDSGSGSDDNGGSGSPASFGSGGDDNSGSASDDSADDSSDGSSDDDSSADDNSGDDNSGSDDEAGDDSSDDSSDDSGDDSGDDNGDDSGDDDDDDDDDDSNI